MNENTEHTMHMDCEEHSFCTSENSEVITPHLRDDCDCFDEAAEAVAEKCREIRNVCEEKVDEMAQKWKTCSKNPYFKHTCTIQTDIYKTPRDEKPIDTVKMEHSWACSLRTLAIVGGTVLAIVLTKKMLGKKC